MTDRHIPVLQASDFHACPRYVKHELSEDQVLLIAKKAVELAREDFYRDVKKEFAADVGQSIINKFTYLLGAIAVGIFFWLESKGFIKL